MIEVRQLGLSMGNTRILEAISTHIEANGMTSILGPNGTGKTSLLRCISGAYQHYQGTVNFKEKSIRDYSLIELAKQRAVVSQSSQLSFPFTAMEIVMMGRNPYLGDNSVKYDVEIANAALQDVDAHAFKDRIFTSLSGGEKQRVQLARALAQIWEQDNSVLFLDEPTSALDLKHQHHILTLCQKLIERRALTVIAILHDLNLASYYCDHAILMKAGNIFQSGKSKNILTSDNIKTIYDIPESIVKRFHIACA